MDDQDMDRSGRTLRRILGWGGALLFSLVVWASLFWLVDRAVGRETPCATGGAHAESAISCPPQDAG